MTQLQSREFLTNHFLFRQLLPGEIDKVLAFATERRYRDGQMIFSKGDEGTGMMIVVEGRILISATAEDGKEITLNYIDQGGILGEISLIDNKKRSANAIAAGVTTLLHIGRSEFIPFLRSNSDVAIQMLIMLCEKLRNTSDMVENIVLPVPTRLAKLLFRLAGVPRDKMVAGFQLALNLSQREIGNLVGTSRETVNKTLSQWQNEGILKVEGSGVVILQPRNLLQIAEAAF